ncbi:MAG: hypothetical protein ACRBHB_19030 [Arenicella sp.]
MWYLFFQTWGWILAAFILGLLIGWWLCCRCKCKKTVDAGVETPVAATVVPAAVADAAELDVEDAWKPQGFAAAPSDVDDLKRIKGVGPVIEKTLNSLGIYHFKQIAEFTADNITWVDNYISFPGRIDREEWVDQAKELAIGRDTEFSKRIDKGDVEY